MQNVFERVQDFLADVLKLDYWMSVLDDPCANDSIIFISAPEPGWCQHSRSPVRSVGEVIVDTRSPSLGLPNPTAARQEVEERMRDTADLASRTDAFEINPSIQAISLGNLADRIVATEFADSVLGEEGQEATARELEAVEAIVEQAQEQVELAESDIATQDVVKRIAVIEGANTTLLAALNNHLAGSRQLDAVASLSLRNISRSLDGVEAQKRREAASLAYRLLTGASQVGLF